MAEAAGPTDDALMPLIRAHSAEALAALSDRHHRATFSLAHRRLDDVGQAEAIVPVGLLAVGCHPGRDDADGGQPRATAPSCR